MRIVIALGGNALLARGDKPNAAIQLTNLRTAAYGALADAQALLEGKAGTTITPTAPPHSITHPGSRQPAKAQ